MPDEPTPTRQLAVLTDAADTSSAVQDLTDLTDLTDLADLDEPRRIHANRSLQDKVFAQSVRLAGILVLVITGSIGIFLGLSSIPTLKHYGWSYFTESRWIPSQDIIGISGALLGTVEVALLALCFAIPLSVLTALFITDWAPAGLRRTLITLLDMMAAVPGIIFGLWVYFLIQPAGATGPPRGDAGVGAARCIT